MISFIVDRISSSVHRGVSRDGRFVGGDARNQEPDGDTRRRDSDLDRFGPSDRCNTLRPVSLGHPAGHIDSRIARLSGTACLRFSTVVRTES